MGKPMQCGNVSGATWWSNLEPMQVAAHGDQILNLLHAFVAFPKFFSCFSVFQREKTKPPNSHFLVFLEKTNPRIKICVSVGQREHSLASDIGFTFTCFVFFHHRHIYIRKYPYSYMYFPSSSQSVLMMLWHCSGKATGFHIFSEKSKMCYPGNDCLIKGFSFF